MINLVGKTILIHDLVASDVVNYKPDEYIIESVLPYEFMQLKEYPSEVYLADDSQWDALSSGEWAWIHPGEVGCILKAFVLINYLKENS